MLATERAALMLRQAIGSMTGDEKEPRSVMSRNKGHGAVVTGGRSIKHRRWPTAHKDTWPANPDGELGPVTQPHQANKRQRTKRVPKGIKASKAAAPKFAAQRQGPSKSKGPAESSRSSGRNGSTSNSIC